MISDRFDKSMNAIITLVLLIGFFVTLGYQLYKGIDAQLMIGALIAAVGSSINFRFQTNAASERKTELLAQSQPIPKPDPSDPTQPAGVR